MKKNILISKEDLQCFQALLVRSMWREMYAAFEKRAREEGLTKADLARRLGVHKSVITRRLNGTDNMTIKILSDMARVLACKPEIKIIPYEEIVTNNHDTSYRSVFHSIKEEATSNSTSYIMVN